MQHDDLCRYKWNRLAEYGACDCEVIANARANERGKWLAYDEVVTRDAWTELHAKVSALPEGAERRWNGDDALIWRSDVLDLIDGGSDD